ncbi:hypothetical protein J4443_02540 [Candidatus Woesearchaeota archaeon]|nr:hypothetical protein [Candidatus Woesearchaeota archaeon]
MKSLFFIFKDYRTFRNVEPARDADILTRLLKNIHYIKPQEGFEPPAYCLQGNCSTISPIEIILG